MKSKITTLVCMLVTLIATSQNNDIKTKSVSIDNLISFIVDDIESKDANSTAPPEHLIFLLQTPVGDLIAEDKVILKQAFKLVSNRLSSNDHLSILAYSGLNGIALNKAASKDLKDIIYTIENLKTSIKEPHKDGIELAYNFAESSKDVDGNCTIIMVRNPKAMIARSDTNASVQNSLNVDKPKKGNAVLLTAITLLPQIISVIKD